MLKRQIIAEMQQQLCQLVGITGWLRLRQGQTEDISPSHSWHFSNCFRLDPPTGWRRGSY